MKQMKRIEKQQLLKILSTMVRFEILHGVAKSPKTISDLHDKIKYPDGKKYDYKAIHKQVMYLEQLGLVEIDQDKKKQGQPIQVSISQSPPLDLKDKDIVFWWNEIYTFEEESGLLDKFGKDIHKIFERGKLLGRNEERERIILMLKKIEHDSRGISVKLEDLIKQISGGKKQEITLGQQRERERILNFINEQRDKGNMGKGIFNPGLCLLDLLKILKNV